MRLSAGLVAGLAVAASAFLLPPNIPDDIKDLRFKGGPPKYVKDFFHALLEGKPTNIDLSCPGCLFASPTGDEDPKWEADIANVVHLEFATSGQQLTLNGHPLLPLEAAQKARSTTIKAHQIRTDTNEQSAEVSLNFAMEVMPPMPSPHKDHVSLIPVEFTVLGLNGVPVKVNTIALKLIQTPNKELVIVQHEEIAFEETPGAQACERTTSWSLCRLKAIIMSRIKSMAESTGEHAGNVQSWVKHRCGAGKKSHGAHRSQGHHGHHHGQHGPHRYRRVGHMLHQTFRFFIIPALLGVIGGLTASAIGMLVGQMVIFLWFRTYRRGQRGPLRPGQQESTIEEDEKDGLLAQEALPQYEDAPHYDAIVPHSEQPNIVSEKN